MDWEDDVQIGPAPPAGPVQDGDGSGSEEEGQAQNDGPRSQPKKQQAGEEAAPEGAARKKRASKPRPKLSLDLLKEPHGMNDVFMKFPHALRAQYKGKGHEVGDLQRLLEMYARWQQRVFPYGKFDDFIVKLEKVGSSATAKSELRELRQGLVKFLAEEDDGQDVGPQGTAQQDQQQGAAAAAPAAAGNSQRVSPAPANHPPAASQPQAEDEPPVEDEFFMNGEEELEAQMANALDAVPDFDEQLFEAPQPPAAPATAAAKHQQVGNGESRGGASEGAAPEVAAQQQQQPLQQQQPQQLPQQQQPDQNTAASQRPQNGQPAEVPAQEEEMDEVDDDELLQ